MVCTLAIYFRCSEAIPLLVAANRDEFLSRPTAEPRLISDRPWVVAGQDLSAGGTWLGVNEHGTVVGLLNRRNPDGPDPNRRSRGLLCLEALQAGGPDAVLRGLRRERADAYNWFNLLVAAPDQAVVVSNRRAKLAVTPLDAGVHVLTNLDVNDPACPRIAKSHRLFAALALPGDPSGIPALLSSLRGILADHAVPLDPRTNDAADTLCVHLPGYGTRSSTILAYGAAERRFRYWCTAGPPCTSDYVEVPLPDGPSNA